MRRINIWDRFVVFGRHGSDFTMFMVFLYSVIMFALAYLFFHWIDYDETIIMWTRIFIATTYVIVPPLILYFARSRNNGNYHLDIAGANG